MLECALTGARLQNDDGALVGQSAPADVQPRGRLNFFDPELCQQPRHRRTWLARFRIVARWHDHLWLKAPDDCRSLFGFESLGFRVDDENIDFADLLNRLRGWLGARITECRNLHAVGIDDVNRICVA